MKRQIPLHTTKSFRQKKSKYALVIPVLNEGEKFKKQIKTLKKYSRLIDIIITDGGSTDGSTNLNYLKQNGVRTLLVKKGFGKIGAQYRIAFDYTLNSGYEGVVCMDGNGKDGPDAIPRFIKKLDEGYDYIQGSRFIRGGKGINTPLSRYVGIRFILSPILSLGACKWYTDTSNGFRALSKNLLENKDISLFRDIFPHYEILFYETVRSTQVGLKTIEIPVTRKYPLGQVPTKITGFKSNFNIIKEALKVSFGYYNP